MGTISYYLAISLDGYLARKDGSVDWLDPFQGKLDSPYDYEEYYKTVSAVLVGRKTLDVARSFESKPYPDKPCYVFTRNTSNATGLTYIRPLREISESIVIDLKKQTNGRIWLVGGANVAAQLNALGQLDEVILTIVPVAIGSGIQWLGEHEIDTNWELSDCLKLNRGVTQLAFRRRNTDDRKDRRSI